MKITKAKLRQIIRQHILQENSSDFHPAFENRTASGITSMAGMDRYGDHRGIFEVMREASEADREIGEFFERAAENCEELLASVEDERMDLEDRAYEDGEGSEADQAWVAYQ